MSREAHIARLEDAIAGRLQAVFDRLGQPGIDIRPGAAEPEGWKSHAGQACRVIWMASDYSGRTGARSGLGQLTQDREHEFHLLWEFRGMTGALPWYPYLQAAREALLGWAPLRADSGNKTLPPPLAQQMFLRRESVDAVDGRAWRYRQVLFCRDRITAEDRTIEQVIERITVLRHSSLLGQPGPFLDIQGDAV